MLNIPSTVVDSNYRYRMPKMQLKIQSKGNGIKTNIVNLPDVAKHLRTDQLYILKYFGYEKASQTSEKASQSKGGKAGDKGKKNTSYIIQGQFSDDQLLKSLDKFIQKYIICPKCKLPQLNMYIVNERINGKCDSCPFNGQIDNKHKLTTHILKNPPIYKPQAIKAVKLIEKVELKSEKTQGEKKQKIKDEEKQQQKKQQIKNQQPANKLFSAQNLQFGSPEMNQLINYTKNFIQARRKQDFDIACAQTVENLKSLNLKKTLFAFVIFNSLFTVNIVKQLKDNAPFYSRLMKRLVSNSDQTNQIQTLLNLQYLFQQANKQQSFDKFIPTILYKVHQFGLLSNDLLIKWSKKEIKDFDKYFLFNELRNEQFLAKSKSFLETLQQKQQEQDD